MAVLLEDIVQQTAWLLGVAKVSPWHCEDGRKFRSIRAFNVTMWEITIGGSLNQLGASRGL